MEAEMTCYSGFIHVLLFVGLQGRWMERYLVIAQK